MDVSISAAINRINEMVNSLIAAFPAVIIGAVVFLIFFVIAGWVKGIIERLTRRSKLERTATLLFGRLSRWSIIFLGLLVALSIIIPSFKPAQLIQLLGIGSIAIGFAFRDIAQNFLAGILILLTRPFRIGDQIITGSYEGTIEEIQTRATIITTYDGRRVVIPNSSLFTDSVTVNTALDKRRTEYDVGISYYDDINRARQVILDVLRSIDGVAESPEPDVLTVALDAYSVNLRARWWTEPTISDVLSVQDKVITRIKQQLDQNEITIPFPVRTLEFGQKLQVESYHLSTNGRHRDSAEETLETNSNKFK